MCDGLVYVLLLQGPFCTFHIRQEFVGTEWTGLKFSQDGKKILISMSIGQLKLVDAFNGHELNTLTVSFLLNSIELIYNLVGLQPSAIYSP